MGLLKPDFADPEVTAIRNHGLLRLINKILPLGHRLYPLVKSYAKRPGMIAIPYGRYTLLFPSQWLKPLTADVIFHGAENKPELSLLKPLLSSAGDTIVDVGAHIGEYVLPLRESSKAPIIAYEPSPVSFAVLKKAVRLNNLTGVELRNKACGRESGHVTLNMGIISYVSHSDAQNQEPEFPPGKESFDNIAGRIAESFEPVQVDQVRLDDDLADADRIGMIKIDVEGFEYHVLSGAEKILKKHKPVLFIELHPGQIEPQGHTLKEVCDLLRPHYRLEFWDTAYEKNPNPVSRFLRRYIPGRPYRFASEEEMLTAAYRSERPAHPHLIAYPL